MMMFHKEIKQNNSVKTLTQMSTMKKKMILAGVSALLVIFLVIGIAFAWYTRLVNVTGMTFDVAEFDVNATYVTDSVIINPYTYSEVDEQLSAPGVMGVIPVKVYTTETNEVEISYSLNIDNATMATEFLDKIQFFYFVEEDGEYVKYYLGYGEEDITGTLTSTEEITEYIYWEWIYEADMSTILISPILNESNVWNGEYREFSTLSQMSNEEIYTAIYSWRTYSSNNSAEDIATLNEKYEEISQNCIFDVRDASTSSTVINLYNGYYTSVAANDTYNAKAYSYASGNKVACGANIRYYIECYSASYDWDYIDTQVAIGAWDDTMTSSNGTTYIKETEKFEDGTESTYLAYQVAMQVSLKMIGVQAEPILDSDTASTSGGGTTVYMAEEVFY